MVVLRGLYEWTLDEDVSRASEWTTSSEPVALWRCRSSGHSTFGFVVVRMETALAHFTLFGKVLVEFAFIVGFDALSLLLADVIHQIDVDLGQ